MPHELVPFVLYALGGVLLVCLNYLIRCEQADHFGAARCPRRTAGTTRVPVPGPLRLRKLPPRFQARGRTTVTPYFSNRSRKPALAKVANSA